ncbi:MAG: hypothetical protein JJE27_02680, partial [Thermoleophilia bacterium]|nr:hypothetical protein [Thermoleophilia bacterium]
MTLWRQFGLRGRLALALVTVAVMSVALATLLANAGLNSRLDQFARERLQSAATHSAHLAAKSYRRDRRWTPAIAAQLDHFAGMNGYRLVILDASGNPVAPIRAARGPRASARVVVGGEMAGTVIAAPVRGTLLTGEDRTLHDRLNRLHLLAGALALLLGLVA